MIALIRLLLGLLAAPFRRKSSIEAENAALRQQLIVLRRKLRGRVKLSNGYLRGAHGVSSACRTGR